MPVWLSVFLAILAPSTALATFIGVRFDASRAQAAKNAEAIQKDAEYWRTDTSALRERLKATEDQLHDEHVHCEQELERCHVRISRLEREVAQQAMELRALRGMP